jgi:ASC-1-like (ASCH) protein
MTHNFQLSNPWFELTKSGKKRFEGRRYWEKTSGIKVGDEIVFSSRTNPSLPVFSRKIIKIHRFHTFEDALKTLGISEILPGVDTISEGIEIYLKYVSLETQIREGIILFEFSKKI